MTRKETKLKKLNYDKGLGLCIVAIFLVLITQAPTVAYVDTTTFTNDCNIGPAIDNDEITIRDLNKPQCSLPDVDGNVWCTMMFVCSWYGQNDYYYYDGDAARNLKISDNDDAMMSAEISGIGWLDFFWSVSSEGNYDYLEFYIDDKLKDRISGNAQGLLTPWEEKNYFINSSGTHKISWRYIKDGSISEGLDAGFVDKVVWDNVVYGKVRWRDPYSIY